MAERDETCEIHSELTVRRFVTAVLSFEIHSELTVRRFVTAVLSFGFGFCTGDDGGVCDLGRLIFAMVGFLAPYENVSDRGDIWVECARVTRNTTFVPVFFRRGNGSSLGMGSLSELSLTSDGT